MPKLRYVSKRFSPDSEEIIRKANEIIAEYSAQGFILTLRQLYYQFVARTWLSNTQTEYKRLGSIINDARLAGLVDWNSIEDRTRNLEHNSWWEGPEDILSALASQYHVDLWAGQKFRPEVWIEKEALVGVIERVCRELDVAWFACRGYNSQSEQWRAGMRLRNYLRKGQTPVVLHLGDHDPSGLDMTEDNRKRLSMFVGETVDLKRLALNMDQVDRYGPPPNPAKVTDSRWAGYSAAHGDDSWELDALEPGAIVELVRDAVLSLCDGEIMEGAKEEQEEDRVLLTGVSDRWEEVKEFLSDDRARGRR